MRPTLLLLTFSLLGVLNSCTAPAPPPPASPAPAAILDLNGRAVDLVSPDHRATVFLFITNDCPISNAYAPEIHRLCDQYMRQDIAFYLVYADPSLSNDDARRHYTDYAYRCPAILDRNHELARRAGATVTPEAAVFLPDATLIYRGRIDNLYVDLGKPRYAATTHDLKDTLEAIVQNRPIQQTFTPAIGCHIPT
jgi:hypothetical protein